MLDGVKLGLPTIAKTAITIALRAQYGERLHWRAGEGNGTVVLQIPYLGTPLGPLAPGPENPPKVGGIPGQWRGNLSVERGGAGNGSVP